MNKSILFFLLGVGLLCSSCVSLSDLTYLQKKDGSDAESVVSQVVVKPYRLQSDDVISIVIKAIDPKLVAIFSPSTTGNETSQSEQGLYFSGFTVDDHGNIRIPILGEVNVIGYTLDEVRLKIEKQLLEEYFNKEADIFVTVKLAGLRYTINGEVGAPGSRMLFKDRVTILEAIANSGDITTVGNRKEVTVIRQFPHGTEMHNVDLTDIDVMQSPYYYIQPNDYIYVKPLVQKTWGTGRTGIESLTTLISILSLATTTFLLIRNN